MKWFKHFSDALDDPFIQELLDEFKHSGYVAWFGLLEIISNENGNRLTGKLSVKPKYLKRKMRISTTKLEEIYNFCASFVEENSDKSERKVKLLFNKSGEKWNFECPKLLELKDNYLKDLQAPSKKPSNHKEEEGEEEKEEENKYTENSKEFRLSLFLFNKIRERKPDYKMPNLQKWSIQSDYILRIDKRDPVEIKKVIEWTQKDEFWQDNILSTAKLRKQYDKLVLKMNKANNQENKNEYDFL
jgi:hypothetical protein